MYRVNKLSDVEKLFLKNDDYIVNKFNYGKILFSLITL